MLFPIRLDHQIGVVKTKILGTEKTVAIGVRIMMSEKRTLILGDFKIFIRRYVYRVQPVETPDIAPEIFIGYDGHAVSLW